MTDVDRRYPSLATLMGAGFNQDYADIFGEPVDVVAAFTGDPIFCARLPREVARLVEGPDDADEVLAALGNNYDYEASGRTAAQFLEQLVELLREKCPAEERRAPAGMAVLRVEDRPPLTLVLDGAELRLHAGAQVQPRAVGEEAGGALRAAVGEEILVVGEIEGRLYAATDTVRLITHASDADPAFEVVMSQPGPAEPGRGEPAP